MVACCCVYHKGYDRKHVSRQALMMCRWSERPLHHARVQHIRHVISHACNCPIPGRQYKKNQCMLPVRKSRTQLKRDSIVDGIKEGSVSDI